MTERVARAAVAVLTAAAALLLPATPASADRVRDNQWHLRSLNVAAAHRISQGEGVTVAVIDTGVDPHPDLHDNLLPGTDVVSGGTGDGRKDADGHGTAMAGLIAAHGKDAGSGALGIAPKAKILPIRVTTPTAPGTNVDLAKGIDYAIEQDVDVINVSSANAPHSDLTRAVEAARAADIVVVAGVGNRPEEVVITFPAFYEGVLAVGATDFRDNHAEVSVTGEKVELTAPGVNIHSTNNGGRYRRSDGTSDATAIVAGAAALIRSRYPDLSAEEVVHRLTATATDKGATGRDPEYGYGVLNLVAALTADVPPLQASGAPSAPGSPGPSPTAIGATPLPSPGAGGGLRALFLLGILVLVAAAIALAVVFTVRRRAHTGRAGHGQPGAAGHGPPGAAGHAQGGPVSPPGGG